MTNDGGKWRRREEKNPAAGRNRRDGRMITRELRMSYATMQLLHWITCILSFIHKHFSRDGSPPKLKKLPPGPPPRGGSGGSQSLGQKESDPARRRPLLPPAPAVVAAPGRPRRGARSAPSLQLHAREMELRVGGAWWSSGGAGARRRRPLGWS